MRIEQNFSLEAYNSFHLPVKTRWFMEYETEEELGRILRDEYFQECLSTHIGSGSNLLFINDYNGIIVHSLIKGMEKERKSPNMELKVAKSRPIHKGRNCPNKIPAAMAKMTLPSKEIFIFFMIPLDFISDNRHEYTH